jgi:hypothetical protein
VNVADDPDSFLIKIAALRMERRRQSGTKAILRSATLTFRHVQKRLRMSPKPGDVDRQLIAEFDLDSQKKYYFFIFWIALRCRECATHAGKMRCGSRYNAVRSRTNQNFNLTIAS